MLSFPIVFIELLLSYAFLFEDLKSIFAETTDRMNEEEIEEEVDWSDTILSLGCLNKYDTLTVFIFILQWTLFVLLCGEN